MRFQGIGKAYYGKRDVDPSDGSYTTTEWFVVFLLPIYPLKSYQLRKIRRDDKSYGIAWRHAITYQILAEVPRQNNRKQIFATYGYSYGGLLLLVASFYLTSLNAYFIFLPLGIVATFLVWALLNSE